MRCAALGKHICIRKKNKLKRDGILIEGHQVPLLRATPGDLVCG